MTSTKIKASAPRPFRGAAIRSAPVLLVSFSAYHLHINLSAAASLDVLIVLFIALWFRLLPSYRYAFCSGCLL
jgi:hypothetical protein